MKKYSCVVFDIDGTLTQTNDLIFSSFNFVAQKYLGKTFTSEEITGFFGPPEEVAILNLVGNEKNEAAFNDLLNFYESNHSSMAKLYPLIGDLLIYLKQKGIILAVFTGKGKKSATITLKELKIEKYFELVVTGSDVLKHKPSSEGLKKIIDHFGLNKNKVLMVGDSVSDVLAAHEIGISMATVLWDSYAREKVEKMVVDYSFERVPDFFNFLRDHTDGEKS
jgi:pyrophosphatase PpaX